VLLWLILGSGQMTSGASEFDDLAACNLAQLTLVRVTHDATQKRGQDVPVVESSCVPRRH
jgi:hypothetical protein